MLDKDTIAHVRASYARLRPFARDTAAAFYARLFELDPPLRAMFRGDLAEQGEKLMAMLASAVRLASRPELLDTVLGALGRRHAAYGVELRHYALVGQALIEALERALGDAFTPAVRTAWIELYGHLATRMIDAAARRAA